ncbi:MULTISPECIES: Rieske (2Fe-2S) protein [Sinorhizobium]|uniref:Rieske (2Fe-2S) protein n=1 Tax=Sinorhizobium TaxID=28105 RepID=UPI000BE9877D|nr:MULTISPECIES: Rieske (2Fe-2S) protein [Sinorhizobium]PDT50066.1 2Fe-2S ferredoxin [Sinorhizobium sp. NG07B]POH33714.1 2Fe-2S ferredoxin [Sinorhizobium americanum]
MAEKHFACRVGDVPTGAAKIVKVKNLTMGVFKLSDGYFAMLNICPHRGAALCEGPVCGTTRSCDRREFVYERSGEIVRCAWHGWEFDIRSGEFLVDPKIKARTFPVSVEDDCIYVIA